MSKKLAGMRFPFDPVEAAVKARALVEGKKRPQAHIFPIEGTDREIFAKRDADGRMTIQRRKLTTNNQDVPGVRARNIIVKACAIALDENIQSKKEGGDGVNKEVVRAANRRCWSGISTKDVLDKIKAGKSDGEIVNEILGTARDLVKKAIAGEQAS